MKREEIRDVFTNKEYHQNRKYAKQRKFAFKDLDIGDFFYNFREEFYGIKLSRFMYFNIDNKQLCRSNIHDSEITMNYLAYYEVY